MNMSVTFTFLKWDALRLIKKHEHERQIEVFQVVGDLKKLDCRNVSKNDKQAFYCYFECASKMACEN